MVTPPAANAFLKTLEEPPAATLFVLTAADQARLLPTVVSRCQTVTLRPVPTRTLAAALASWESWPDRNAENAELFARLSGGCPGAAVLATQQPDYLTARQHWLDQVSDLVSADRHQRLATVVGMTTRSAAAPLLDRWLTWWRDVLLLRSGSEEGITHWDQRAVLANLAARLRPSEIAACEPYLTEQIGGIRPKLIVTLGRFAMQYFVPGAAMGRSHGKVIQSGAHRVYPVYHPAAALRQGALARVLREDFDRIPALLATSQRPAAQATGAALAGRQDPAKQLSLL